MYLNIVIKIGTAKQYSNHFSYLINLFLHLLRLEATVVGFFKGHSDLYDEIIVAANEIRVNNK